MQYFLADGSVWNKPVHFQGSNVLPVPLLCQQQSSVFLGFKKQLGDTLNSLGPGIAAAAQKAVGAVEQVGAEVRAGGR